MAEAEVEFPAGRLLLGKYLRLERSPPAWPTRPFGQGLEEMPYGGSMGKSSPYTVLADSPNHDHGWRLQFNQPEHR